MSSSGGAGHRPGPPEWLPVIARVECRSEGSAEERPVALWIGGARLAVGRILSDAVVGPAESGQPVRRELGLETEDGRRFRLKRALPDGEWRVLVAASP